MKRLDDLEARRKRNVEFTGETGATKRLAKRIMLGRLVQPESRLDFGDFL